MNTKRSLCSDSSTPQCLYDIRNISTCSMHADGKFTKKKNKNSPVFSRADLRRREERHGIQCIVYYIVIISGNQTYTRACTVYLEDLNIVSVVTYHAVMTIRFRREKKKIRHFNSQIMQTTNDYNIVFTLSLHFCRYYGQINNFISWSESTS